MTYGPSSHHVDMCGIRPMSLTSCNASALLLDMCWEVFTVHLPLATTVPASVLSTSLSLPLSLSSLASEVRGHVAPGPEIRNLNQWLHPRYNMETVSTSPHCYFLWFALSEPHGPLLQIHFHNPTNLFVDKIKHNLMDAAAFQNFTIKYMCWIQHFPLFRVKMDEDYWLGIHNG